MWQFVDLLFATKSLFVFCGFAYLVLVSFCGLKLLQIRNYNLFFLQKCSLKTLIQIGTKEIFVKNMTFGAALRRGGLSFRCSVANANWYHKNFRICD
jgi:hypothetical protein